MNLHRPKCIAAVSLCIILAACGGGNSGSTTNPSGSTSTLAQDTSANDIGTTPGSTNGNSVTTASSTNGNAGNSNTGSSTETLAFVYDETARFNTPADIKSDATGNLYVLDKGNKTIRRIAVNGSVSTLPVTFTSPSAMDIDAVGNLYVTDVHTVFKITSAGVVSTLATLDSSPGVASIATDSQANVYVLTPLPASSVRRITPTGEVTTLSLSNVRYRGIAVDRAGNLYLGVYGSSNTNVTSILKISPAGAQTVFAEGDFGDVGNMTFDQAGNLYISQYRELIPGGSCAETSSCFLGGTDQIIKKIDSTGTVTIILSGPPGGTIGDVVNNPSFGRFGIGVGVDGSLYVAYERKQAIYRITQSGQATLIAGKPGEAGNSD